jgi:chromate transporter
MSALPSFQEAVWLWAYLGCASFGGPAGQIALMHKLLVDEKRWIGDARFIHALNYCMLLPGPEAQQLATYVGWLMHGVKGGLAAGLLFILPGALVMLGLSILYVNYADLAVVNAIFYGVKAAVLAIVVEALFRIAKRAFSAALAAITAAVVGVILNLAIWFALHVLFAKVDRLVAGPVQVSVPDVSSLDPTALVLAAIAALALMRFKMPILTLLALSAALGLAVRFLAP